MGKGCLTLAKFDSHVAEASQAYNSQLHALCVQAVVLHGRVRCDASAQQRCGSHQREILRDLQCKPAGATQPLSTCMKPCTLLVNARSQQRCSFYQCQGFPGPSVRACTVHQAHAICYATLKMRVAGSSSASRREIASNLIMHQATVYHDAFNPKKSAASEGHSYRLKMVYRSANGILRMQAPAASDLVSFAAGRHAVGETCCRSVSPHLQRRAGH